MNGYALFSDVSVNPQRRIGIGGYLLVPESFLGNTPIEIDRNEIAARLKTAMFTETSSTKLEVQTVLWALEDLREELACLEFGSLKIFTDSQCVFGLGERRSGLTMSDYIGKRSGQPLANALLYRTFYAAYDQLGFQVIKVAGHSRSGTHDTVRRIFSYVDREVREKLSLWLYSEKATAGESS